MNLINYLKSLVVILLIQQVHVYSQSQPSEILKSTTWFEYEYYYDEFFEPEKIVYKNGKELNYFMDYDSAYIYRSKSMGYNMIMGNEIGIDTIIELELTITDSTISKRTIELEPVEPLYPEYTCNYPITDFTETLIYDIFTFDKNSVLVIYDTSVLLDGLFPGYYYAKDSIPYKLFTKNYNYQKVEFNGYSTNDIVDPNEWYKIDTCCLYKNNPVGNINTGYVLYNTYVNRIDTCLKAFAVNDQFFFGFEYYFDDSVKMDTSFSALVSEIGRFFEFDQEEYRQTLVSVYDIFVLDPEPGLIIYIDDELTLTLYNAFNENQIFVRYINKLWLKALTAGYWQENCSFIRSRLEY